MDILCDLVLLSWNHLEETRPCLESLFRHTDVPSRLLIVDNGSESRVRRALEAVRPQDAIQDVVLLQNETNEGFRKGMNRGLRASRAPYVCLLNNDTQVTTGWLKRMVEVAEAHPEIGVLNPSSNIFGDRPCAGESLEAHAGCLVSRRGEWVEVGTCIGFCLLIKRAVIDQIGVLIEEEPAFFFEDDDYSRRAQAAGFFCAVVPSAYVYHAEHGSIRQLPLRERVFRESRRAYRRRWGRLLRVAYLPEVPAPLGSSALCEVMDRAVGWARRRSLVYLYAEGSGGTSRDEAFRSVGRVPHADVLWSPCVGGPRKLWRILKRQKKRFDLILTSDATLARWLRALGWLHGASVVDPRDGARLEELWQAKSRSQS